MCVVAVSRFGSRLPTKAELQAMWDHNPDGAGFMFARSGKVYIRKGFMTFASFWAAVRSEKLTRSDAVVYHFRISTQAGRSPAMTHPFPLTNIYARLEDLSTECNIGIAHNGIIKMTTNGDKHFSDTALFVADYLPSLIRTADDLTNERIQTIIETLGGWSKFAFMRGDGNIVTIGTFYDDGGGLLLSNKNHKPLPVEYRSVSRFPSWNFYND